MKHIRIMKASSLKEIKTELSILSKDKLLDICMRLAKYKKENKELLTYLLFETDEQSYIKSITEFIDEQFSEMNMSNLYLVKKSTRKILRTVNKFIKYSGSKQTEVELLIYFCKKVLKLKIPIETNITLGNIYQRQIQKINKALSSLHEDLQYDYSLEIKSLY